MWDIKLSSTESFTPSSEKIKVVPNEEYFVSVESIGFEGNPYSAYFGVLFFDKEDKEIQRITEWLNDFSGFKKENFINFVVPPFCSSVLLIYRINKETAKQSKCHFKLLPLEMANIFPRLLSDSKKELYPISEIKQLTNEEELKLEQNLVFVFSSPRSGTTWLSLDLLSHRNHTMDEPQIGRHLGQNVSYKNEQLLIYDSFFYHPDYFFCYKYSKTWLYYLRKLILNRIYAQFTDLTSKIIIKEPNGSIGASILTKCLPQSRIIFLIRDGRDVVDSKLDGIRSEGFSTQKPGVKDPMRIVRQPKKNIPENVRLNVLKFQSKLWDKTMKSIIKAYENHEEKRKIMIHYEDLLLKTNDILRKIYDFIEVEITDNDIKKIVSGYSFSNIPEEIRGPGEFYRSGSVGLWKKNLNEEEKMTANEIMGDMLSKLGYEV